MTRNEFFKCCGIGVCACAGAAAASPDETEALKGRVDFLQMHFAKLVSIIETNVEEGTRKKVWEGLGRDHAQDFRIVTAKYKGNLRGFLAEIRRHWVEEVDYDEKAGTIRIVDKSRTCSCPFVKPGVTPPSFCDCTLGWQKETYSAIAGRPVEVALEQSILRGADRCIYRIRIPG